jgi:Predicted membrane-bound metal-dependent hydrolase (DUF457).
MILFGHLGLTYAITRTVDKVALKGKAEIDYRLVFIGSMLPDIIDKPIIFLLSNDSIHSGRIFAHTLLFTLLLSVIGFLVRKKASKPWLLVLAGSSLIHLILDSMWHYPDILFWPSYGLSSMFKQGFNNVSLNSIYNVLSSPASGIPELCGFIIVVILAIKLLIGKQTVKFIKTGHIQ